MKDLATLRAKIKPSQEAWFNSPFGQGLISSVVLSGEKKERWVSELRGDATFDEDIFREQLRPLLPTSDLPLLDSTIFPLLPEVFQTACAMRTEDGNIVMVSAAFAMSLRWPLVACQGFLQCMASKRSDLGIQFKEAVGESVVLFARLAHNWGLKGEERDLFMPTLLPERIDLVKSLSPKLPPFDHLAMLYLLLHELGHLALGHVGIDPEGFTNLADLQKGMERSRDQEHEADIYAWDCFCRLPYPFEYLTGVVGTLFHFMENTSKIRGCKPSFYDTHPPAGSRLLALELADKEPDENILEIIEHKMFYFGHPFPLPDFEELKSKLEAQCVRI
jgi:hypothetical protein